MHNVNRGEIPATVTLLLEGTYPYVRGGVSSWVHQLVGDLAGVNFAIVFLGSTRASYGEMQYKLPSNVVHLEHHYLMDTSPLDAPRARKGNRAYLVDLEEMLRWLRAPDIEIDEDVIKRLFITLGEPQGMTAEDFFYSEAAWDFLRENYERHCAGTSFIDYFWTIRTIPAPLFKLCRIARQVPPTRLCHSISTGYAGCLGAILHWSRGDPLVLSEHGIYTKERRIDLQTLFVSGRHSDFTGATDTTIDFHQRLWIRFFEGLGRLTYLAAGTIISLHERNRARQIKDGARAERTEVIPNGVDVGHFLQARASRSEAQSVPLVVGLIGRIVPIKDIKTFVRAIRIIVSRLPAAQGWLIGPEEEDQAYVEECRNVIQSLGLEQRVSFRGFQRPDHIMPQLGLVVLTSISEAFPLVLTEAFASGVPVVATDVGACREMIEGRTPEDRALGAAGAVVPIADPEATAEAAIALLTNEVAWRAARAAGIARVERYYTRAAVFKRYREIYREAGL